MKVVIFCGGIGTRMKEETEYRPKPLVNIDGRPIIWHIMKLYSSYGYNEFILCVGYKSEMIKEYFMNMDWRNNDFTLHIKNGEKSIEYHRQESEDWKITIVDTGLETMTAGRLKRVEKYIDGDTFMLTYGDGLSDVNINNLIEYHNHKGRIGTITGVNPISQFGIIKCKDGIAKSFKEKPQLAGFVNGGFMVFNKKIFDYIPDYDCMFEQEPLKVVSKDGELAVYEHYGFFKAIDTFKDVEFIKNMCVEENCPWKIWENESENNK